MSIEGRPRQFLCSALPHNADWWYALLHYMRMRTNKDTWEKSSSLHFPRAAGASLAAFEESLKPAVPLFDFAGDLDWSTALAAQMISAVSSRLARTSAACLLVNERTGQVCDSLGLGACWQVTASSSLEPVKDDKTKVSA